MVGRGGRDDVSLAGYLSAKARNRPSDCRKQCVLVVKFGTGKKYGGPLKQNELVPTLIDLAEDHDARESRLGEIGDGGVVEEDAWGLLGSIGLEIGKVMWFSTH